MYPVLYRSYNVLLVRSRISNDCLSSQVSATAVALGRTDSKRKLRRGISFNPTASALASCNPVVSAERGRTLLARGCSYVCIVHALCTLVLEMHWRLGANHSPRRRGVSGAAARQNILPSGGRRSCPTDDQAVGSILRLFFPAISHRWREVDAEIGLGTTTIRRCCFGRQRDRRFQHLSWRSKIQKNDIKNNETNKILI